MGHESRTELSGLFMTVVWILQKLKRRSVSTQIGNSRVAPVLTTTWDELEPEGREDIRVCLFMGEG